MHVRKNTIFNNRLIIGVQNYIKNNGKNYIFLKNMHCDVHYRPTKFEFKIQLMYGEKNKLCYGAVAELERVIRGASYGTLS